MPTLSAGGSLPSAPWNRVSAAGGSGPGARAGRPTSLCETGLYGHGPAAFSASTEPLPPSVPAGRSASPLGTTPVWGGMSGFHRLWCRRQLRNDSAVRNRGGPRLRPPCRLGRCHHENEPLVGGTVRSIGLPNSDPPKRHPRFEPWTFTASNSSVTSRPVRAFLLPRTSSFPQPYTTNRVRCHGDIPPSPSRASTRPPVIPSLLVGRAVRSRRRRENRP